MAIEEMMNDEPCNGECHADCDPYPACELKLCPFCRGTAGEMEHKIAKHTVYCDTAGCTVSVTGRNRAEAIAAWNRRALPDRDDVLGILAAELGKLRVGCAECGGFTQGDIDGVLAVLEGK